MAAKNLGEDQELTEAWPSQGNKTIWQPNSVSDKISLSLRSIDSTASSLIDEPTTPNTTNEYRVLLDSKKSAQQSHKDSIRGNSSRRQNSNNNNDIHEDDILDGTDRNWFGTTSEESFFSASTNSYGLLKSLRPSESLPQLDSNNTPAETASKLSISTTSPSACDSRRDGYSNSNNKNKNKSIKNSARDFSTRSATSEYQSSKMAGRKPEDDYGNTLRKTVEGAPDYESDDTPSPRNVTESAAEAKNTSSGIENPRKKMAGAVRLPIYSSDKGSAHREATKLAQTGRKDKTRQPKESKPYSETIRPEDAKDLSKLASLREDTINECLRARYLKDLIYTRCGDIMISVNPFKSLGIYTKEQMDAYSHLSISEDPHLYMISAKAYQDLRLRKTDQVILVSGESGAGKTEATKLLVQHIISMAGSYEASLQDKIIQVNPLLENFGNAKTILNNNSSRFAKFLRLSFNSDTVVQSAKIQDFMLEKSRVVHYQNGESTYHSFYALLAGLANPSALYIEPGQMFRITGSFSSTKSRSAKVYKEMYSQQQKVFELLEMNKEEREDVDIILAAILHIADVTFEDDVNDCVVIQNEDAVQKVANLLDLDNEKLTKALIERRGKIGKGEFIQFSKKKRQAEEERDALAKTLYEKLFGWIVRKINDALVPQSGSNAGSIGILDICGFEDVGGNTFEQLCINIINEHLQNFMNNKVIKDERELYEQEGIPLGDIDTEGVNNDAVLNMFLKKNGILDSIDEDSKIEVVSDDVKMVRKMDELFRRHDHYIPATSNRAEFTIRHFAGKVKYDGTSFIKKNCDSLGDLVEECLKDSGSLLVKDLFHVEPSYTGSISMSQYQFRGSKRGGQAGYRPLMASNNLSRSINKSTRASLTSRFGTKLPSFKSDLSSKKTHIYYFKNSLEQLRRSMQTAIPYFVRCIKPNDHLKPGQYDHVRVFTQLKYNGIAEIARIRSCGLPVRMSQADFINRYGDLATSGGDEEDHVTRILQSVNAESNNFKIGVTQVFLTTEVQALLDEDLTELRRRQEEERRRREEERKKREAEERRKKEELERKERERLLIEERHQKAKAEEKDKETQRQKEKKRRERERREEEERNRREAEEERKRALEELKVDLKMGKSVGFMDSIQEVPTPASSLYDSSVYNRAGSSSSNSRIDRPPNPNGKSTETVVTIVDNDNDDDDDDDDDEGNGNSTDDTLSVDDYSEWVDHFQELTEEEVREDLSDLRTLKVIKVIIYIFLALLLLVSLVVQKVSFIKLVQDLVEPRMDADDIKGKTPPQIAQQKERLQMTAYFMLVLILCIPYGIGFLLSFLKHLFGISKVASMWTWIWVLGVECLHSVGLCLLVFRVMARLNIFEMAYLMSVTAAIPSVLKLFFSDRIETKEQEKEKQAGTGGYKAKKAFSIFLDFLAFGVQCSAPVAVVLMDFYGDWDATSIAELVAGLVLVSANQWENFMDGTLCGFELNDMSWFKNKVLKLRYELQESRNYPNTLAFLIKIGLTILLSHLLCDQVDTDYDYFVDYMTYDYRLHSFSFFVPVAAATIGAFIAFNTSVMALKLQMQRFSFALPLCLATPGTVAVLYTNCRYEYLDFVSQSVGGKGNTSYCNDRLMKGNEFNLIFFGGFWLLSLLIICRHIWRRQQDKNSDMNRLFLDPIYCGILTTEQIMMNQRRHQNKIDENKKLEGNEISPRTIWYKINRLATFSSDDYDSQQQDSAPAPNDHVAENGGQGDGEPPNPNNNPNGVGRKHVTPKIYACATMWHETRTEMVQLLKSIHRLDLDQYIRRYRLETSSKAYDPNYYEFEAHIFFDDAMEKDDDNHPVPNRWVKDLVGAMNEACSSVHCKPMLVYPPVKIVTPYGGQLVWTMPGENLLFVHLKDMDKIRNRKRWSQVMYMYYLLNYRLGMFCKQEAVRQMEKHNKDRGQQGLNIQEINILLGEEHAARADNTFILALDGDTDFLPISIRMLMQRMDVGTVGATCGRIHPIGNGPMVWYQKFEYAIGHWLQKASEHVFGCVLCSPGCFSLFRARALMDANVVKRYTTEPTEPSHHLQYDQGEDRWLCTLLLQRGYRIEYAAGADAWTFAPEGFFEFFNQRRRWMPSTIANILDLLGSADRTRKENPNISLPYILYTWLLMLMTLLGPGTILMMMAGAFQLIFALDITWAFLWSIVPAAVFTVACFWLKTKWQLLMAATLSIGYGFIMVIVIVGTIITATTENIFHPSVIIMVGLLAIFMITGLFHPKEISCLVHGILYILCIPSGYLLLVIYSICNLNDVSWGTREVPTKAQRLANEEKQRKKEEEKLNKPKKSLFKRLFDSGEGQLSELTNLLKTIMPKQGGQAAVSLEGQAAVGVSPQDESNMVKILSDIAENTRLTRELLEGKTPQGVTSQPSSKQSTHASSPKDSVTVDVTQLQAASATPKAEGKKKKKKKEKKTKTSEYVYTTVPRWTQDESLGNGQVIPANKEELRFWTGMIDRYLRPIRPTTGEKKKIADGLKDLRNSAAFAFILVNLLWMSLNFMFLLTEAAKVHLTYSFGGAKYEVEESVLGMSFVFLLLILLILQFVGMVIHRMGVLQQLLSTTKIWGKDEEQGISQAAGEDVGIRRIKAALQVPAVNDVFGTLPPIANSPDDPSGCSVRPSASTDFTEYNGMEASLEELGSIVTAHRNNALEEGGKDFETFEEVTRRLGGSQIRDRLPGVSFRPNLPPRKTSTKRDSKDRWLTRQGNFAMTTKELRKFARPGETIIEDGGTESAVERANALWQTTGAVGRSLKLRAMEYQRASKDVGARAKWTDADVASNPRARSRTLSGRHGRRSLGGQGQRDHFQGHHSSGGASGGVNTTRM